MLTSNDKIFVSHTIDRQLINITIFNTNNITINLSSDNIVGFVQTIYNAKIIFNALGIDYSNIIDINPAEGVDILNVLNSI